MHKEAWIEAFELACEEFEHQHDRPPTAEEESLLGQECLTDLMSSMIDTGKDYRKYGE